MNPDVVKALVAFNTEGTKVFVCAAEDQLDAEISIRQLAEAGWPLPFPQTTVVFNSDKLRGIPVFTLVVADEALRLGGGVYDKVTDTIRFEFFAQLKKDFTLVIEGTDLDEEVVYAYVIKACTGVVEINKSGGTAYVAHPHEANARRKAKGKRPLFTWTTINLDAPRYKSEPKGGTHAPPRLHDRRGHWATSKLGKRFWRKDSKVGSAKNGITIQSYEKGVGMH